MFMIMDDQELEIRQYGAAIVGDAAVEDLLAAVCDVSGLGFAVIAEVSEHSWTARAVLDRIQMNVVAGQHLDVNTTLCRQVCRTRKLIVMDHASADPRYATDPVPKLYGFESYISAPIILENGEYFGNLCALDRRPSSISDPRLQLMFHCYARLIAQHLQAQTTRQSKRLAPLNRLIVGNLRGLFSAMLALSPPQGAQPAVESGQLPAELAPAAALRQLAARVASQTHSMWTLVNDVLVYARGRLTGGMPGYIWKVDDLHARLKSVVADAAAANPHRTIITNIAFDQPVDCDPRLIQELASRLLSNALAHNAPTGPVSFIASTHDNDLEIAVWNEGNPLAKTSLRDVFSATLPSGGDPGAAQVSLHTCAAIVRAHLGTIGVTSSPTEGTQIVARIPVARSLRLH